MRNEAAEATDEEHAYERCGVCQLRVGAGGCARRRSIVHEQTLRAEVVVDELEESAVPLRRSA